MKKSLFVYSLTLLALAFAACSDNAKKSDTEECVGEDCGNTPDIVVTPLVRHMASQKGCALDMDCAEGAFCFNGQCVIQCSKSLAIDCETGYLCDDTRGRCVTTTYINELKKIEDQIEAAGDSMSDQDKAALRATAELKAATEGNVRRSVLGQKNENDATVEDITFARRMDSAVLFNPNAQSQTVSFKTKDSIGDVLYAVKMDGVDLPILKKSTGVQNSDGSYTYNFEIETSKILQSRRLRSKLRSGGDIEPDATVVDIVSNAGTFQSEIVDPIDASGIYEGKVIPEAVLSGTPLPIRMGIQTTPEKVTSFTDITDITLILPVSGSDLFSPETPTADGKESWASLKMSKKSASECGSNTPCFAADFSTNDYAPAGSQLFGEDQHVNRSIRIEIFDFDAPSLTFTGRIVDRLKGLYRIASIQEGNIHRDWNDTSMVGGFSVTLANSIDDSVSIHEHQSDNESIRDSDENPVDICTTNDIKALITKIEDPFSSCDTVTDVDEKARCEAIKRCKTVSSKSAFDELEADAQWACVQYIASGITNDNARLSNILAQVLEADVTGNNSSDPIVTVCGKDIHNFAEFQSVCDDKTCTLCNDHPEYICEADLLARTYLKNQMDTDEQASVMTAWTSVIRESYLAQQYLAWNNDNKIRREWLEGAEIGRAHV